MHKPKQYLDFLWAMTVKEIKARYKNATFGFFWILLNPVFQMVIIGVVFSFFIDIPNYYLFLFSGLLPWMFFNLSLSKATPSFVYERRLLQKGRFPIEAIPVSIILSNFIHMLISLILLFVLLVFLGLVNFPSIFLLLPALLWLFVFTVGISLLTSTLNVRFRDMNFFVKTALTLWFYATPVIYHLGLIPETLNTIFYLNPLSSVFELFHISLVGEGTIDGNMIIVNLVLSLLFVALGILVFKKEREYFVDWL